jgi:hypothetical protein
MLLLFIYSYYKWHKQLPSRLRLCFAQPSIAALNANGIHTTKDLIGINEKDTDQILKTIKTGPPPVQHRRDSVSVATGLTEDSN